MNFIKTMLLILAFFAQITFPAASSSGENIDDLITTWFDFSYEQPLATPDIYTQPEIPQASLIPEDSTLPENFIRLLQSSESPSRSIALTNILSPATKRPRTLTEQTSSSSSLASTLGTSLLPLHEENISSDLYTCKKCKTQCTKLLHLSNHWRSTRACHTEACPYPNCSRIFSYSEDHISHIQNEHPDFCSFQCSTASCLKRFLTQARRDNHHAHCRDESELAIGSPSCKTCTRSFPTITDLAAHWLFGKPCKSNLCPYPKCTAHFDSEAIYGHIQDCHPRFCAFTCRPPCTKAFLTYRRLDNHYKKEHSAPGN